MENFDNKIKAVVLGHAVADALGVPVEFYDRSEVDEVPVTDMMGYGRVAKITLIDFIVKSNQ